MAQITDYQQIHQVRYRKTVGRVLSIGLLPGSRILDIGCYPLDLFDEFAGRGFKMTGISSDHEPVRRKNIVRLNIETDPFPFPTYSFDAVFLFEVVEHLLFSPEKYLKKIRAVLKPGGRLFITTPNAVHLKNRLAVLLGKSASFPVSDFPDTAHCRNLYFRHNREFTGQEITQMLKIGGFRDIRVSYFNSYTPFRHWSTRDPLPVRLVKFTGFSLSHLHPTFMDTLFAVASV